MASADSYFLQPFKTHRKRLVPAQKIPAKSRQQALSEGARLGRTAEGLAVLHVVADDETGEPSRIEVLERHGAIPEQFEEEIRAL